jgi:energy-coupling factor transporter ATP-binding protein EcfA2
LIALTLRRGDRLDLDLRTAARRLVVIGANGSGKTSLVRAVAGTDVRPDDRIVVGGVELSGLPPQDRGLALVATDPALAPRTPAASSTSSSAAASPGAPSGRGGWLSCSPRTAARSSPAGRSDSVRR